MGKRIVSQRRGRGSIRYRAKSHLYRGDVRHVKYTKESFDGKVLDLVHCPGHNAPLAEILYNNGERGYMIAPEGLSVGTIVGVNNECKSGCVMELGNIPEGALVYNIEGQPGDGGKFVRSSGTFAKIVSKDNNRIIIKMPSGKTKSFLVSCRAAIGVVAGGGRKEKPFVKAGKKWHAMRARGRLYPVTSGVAMNATDHPFGCGRGRHVGKPKTPSRFAPPGRKVGQIGARRCGRKRRK